MKMLLVALALLSMPMAASPWLITPSYAAATATEFGDLSVLRTIATDTLDLVAKGDMAAATARITDFETAWDADASRLRVLSADKWGVIDDASDAAITSLRASPLLAADATAAVTALIAALDNPTMPATRVGAATAVTDANGRPLPCEDLLADVRATTAAVVVSDADKPKLDDLTNKGLERCNADDDKRADDFFAQALALMDN
jgi:hypothetical protein